MKRPMARRPRLSKPLWLLLTLLAFGLQWWAQRQAPEAPLPAAASRQFERLEGAQLEDGRNNDGDSFLVRHQGRVHELRLYFADCPEKRRHAHNGERLREQGRYFGGLSEAQTVDAGQRAQAFALDLLRSRRFTVHTKWQRVYDSRRVYAFVIFDDGEDLSAKLVREGLARIHTGGTTLPDGRSVKTYLQELRALEAAAKRARRGAWGLR